MERQKCREQAVCDEDIYATDIAFYETNEGPVTTSYQAINELISALQSKWHPDFKFEITQVPSANHGIEHVAWTLGIPGQEPVASGMDIAVIANGKIKSLHLFLNA